MRDSQRSKVYNAERMVDAWKETPYDALSGAEAFIDKVTGSPYTQRKWGYIKPAVMDGRGCRSARGSRYQIVLPRWARTRLVILHELAHGYTAQQARIAPKWFMSPGRPTPFSDYNGIEYASHGWQFCTIYLDLVRHFIGKQAHDELKAAFKTKRVKSRRPRAKRPATPQQLAALAKARAARKVQVG